MVLLYCQQAPIDRGASNDDVPIEFVTIMEAKE